MLEVASFSGLEIFSFMLLETKIQLSKLEDLIGFSKWFMSRLAAHLATRWRPKGRYEREGFCRKKGEGQGRTCFSINRKKKGLFLDQNISWWGVDCLFFLWGVWGTERAQVTDYFTGAWPGNSWLIKITFLGEIETAVSSGSKSRFGIMGF